MDGCTWSARQKEAQTQMDMSRQPILCTLGISHGWGTLGIAHDRSASVPEA